MTVVAFASVPATKSQNIRSRHQNYEVYRTPITLIREIIDYRPSWFEGSSIDPAAGDGRMTRELQRRANDHEHHVFEIREEERQALERLPNTNVRMENYLTADDLPECDFMFVNPPFSLAQQFVERAMTHCQRVIMLHSTDFMSTAGRSRWLPRSGLRNVIQIPTRPKWEVSDTASVTNCWNSACYVFEKDYVGYSINEWLER